MAETNPRNIRPHVMYAPGHGFVAGDLKAWGGLLIRWDTTANAGAGGWVKGDDTEAGRATTCITKWLDADNFEAETFPGEDYITGAVGNLDVGVVYYPAADGDVALATTTNGGKVLMHNGDGIVQFYDHHEPPPAIYNKLRLTCTTMVPAGTNISFAAGTLGEAGGIPSFAIHADRNSPMTFKATKAEHDLDDELFITLNRGVVQNDYWTWVDTGTLTTADRIDVDGVINVVQRV